MRGAYLRSDLPDEHADKLIDLAEALFEGANDLHSGSQSRDQADRYHAAIDAKRLMNRAAERLMLLAKSEKVPG